LQLVTLGEAGLPVDKARSCEATEVSGSAVSEPVAQPPTQPSARPPAQLPTQPHTHSPTHPPTQLPTQLHMEPPAQPDEAQEREMPYSMWREKQLALLDEAPERDMSYSIWRDFLEADLDPDVNAEYISSAEAKLVHLQSCARCWIAFRSMKRKSAAIVFIQRVARGQVARSCFIAAATRLWTDYYVSRGWYESAKMLGWEGVEPKQEDGCQFM